MIFFSRIKSRNVFLDVIAHFNKVKYVYINSKKKHVLYLGTYKIPTHSKKHNMYWKFIITFIGTLCIKNK